MRNISLKLFCVLISCFMFTGLCTSTVFAEDRSEYENESYAIDPDGNVVPVTMTMMESTMSDNNDEYHVTYCYDLANPNAASGSGSMHGTGDGMHSGLTMTDYDNRGLLRAVVTITYNRNGNTYLLTKVNGSITSYDSATIITSKRLEYGCSSTFVTQRSTAYPGMTYSYNTNFTRYITDNGDCEMGATLYINFQNSGNWSFVVDNRLLRSNSWISGRWS